MGGDEEEDEEEETHQKFSQILDPKSSSTVSLLFSFCTTLSTDHSTPPEETHSFLLTALLHFTFSFYFNPASTPLNS